MINGACTKADYVTIDFDDLAPNLYTIPVCEILRGDGLCADTNMEYGGLYWQTLFAPDGLTESGYNGAVFSAAYPPTGTPVIAVPQVVYGIVSPPNAVLTNWLRITAPGDKTFTLISMYVSGASGMLVELQGYDAAGMEVYGALQHTPLLADKATLVTVEQQYFTGLSKLTVRLLMNNGAFDYSSDSGWFVIDNIVLQPSIV